MRYVYSIVRFVPDPVRGEFVNIGMIVGSEETDEWQLRLVDNMKRARALDGQGILSSVWRYVTELETRLDLFEEAVEASEEPSERISEKWLEKLWEDFGNVVQLSRPAPLDTDSIIAAFDLLFPQFIIDPESRRYNFQKKNVATAALRRAYREYGLQKGANLFETPTVSGRHHRERFDFAVANGNAVQLTHTFSFQLPDKEKLAEDIKAWAFTVEDIRTSGGNAVKDARQVQVPADVPIAIAYVPPSDQSGAIALDEAMRAFERVRAEAFPIDQVKRISSVAHDLLRSKH